MNYYKRHLGDYLRDTIHLTPAQDGFYNRMLDHYYVSEKPLPLDREQIYSSVRVKNEEEKVDVNAVLLQFFKQKKDGYHHKRCDAVIRDYKRKSCKNRRNGQKGGKKKPTGLPIANPLGTPHGGYKPLATSHKPLTTKIQHQTPGANTAPFPRKQSSIAGPEIHNPLVHCPKCLEEVPALALRQCEKGKCPYERNSVSVLSASHVGIRAN